MILSEASENVCRGGTVEKGILNQTSSNAIYREKLLAYLDEGNPTYMDSDFLNSVLKPESTLGISDTIEIIYSHIDRCVLSFNRTKVGKHTTHGYSIRLAMMYLLELYNKNLILWNTVIPNDQVVGFFNSVSNELSVDYGDDEKLLISIVKIFYACYTMFHGRAPYYPNTYTCCLRPIIGVPNNPLFYQVS